MLLCFSTSVRVGQRGFIATQHTVLMFVSRSRGTCGVDVTGRKNLLGMSLGLCPRIGVTGKKLISGEDHTIIAKDYSRQSSLVATQHTVLMFISSHRGSSGVNVTGSENMFGVSLGLWPRIGVTGSDLVSDEAGQ